ncbi:zf-DHHC-domain-containing protein [Paraphaeosphaeria sporulosa]|uniref:Palmitoyltransferase n=1 Tax=Paraphaeosphaeria sporulosa TaxID=1460663 RepID=A0A177CPU4_9PLEO|nr:zf-DHHC-domain-containing protein [Paraphaeosphaeria sporulosa]OAG09543.1 zf-DHHC-domain-containing protein [Paraphaeosphaeria sporulosa]
MRRRAWARKVERFCCSTITYFPLVFVYGLTSWAAWVQVGIGFNTSKNRWTGKSSSALGFFLYMMLNWSYTTAVFTDPGSPLNVTNGYSQLPTQEGGGMQYTSFTVKASTGDIRFCKKCQAQKPDRAHHCSTCKRCVLKMDHHCPWLAACVGLHNYKAFLLFLIYLTFFCWVAFATSATWVWTEILNDGNYSESFMPVNYVLLAVLSGIIGVVITGFTAWHCYLTIRGQTTIESLEKTRYLSPLRNSMKAQLSDRNYLDAQANGRLSISDQLREIHANALPGITRPEEGVSSPSQRCARSPAPTSNGYSHPNQQSYEYRERQQRYESYESYLDERDNEQLPNAFDLGWKRNVGHVFGPSALLWFVPICNTTGDGWSWEASPKWLAARERIKNEREAEERIQKQRERDAGWGVDSPTEAEFRRDTRAPEPWQINRFAPPQRAPRRPEWQESRRRGQDARYLTTSNGIVSTPTEGRRSPSKADQILGRENGMYADGDVQLQSIDRRKFDRYNYISDDDEGDDYEMSSDEASAAQRKTPKPVPLPKNTRDWNDIPDDFLSAPPKGRRRSPGTSRERTPNKAGRRDDWGKDD